MSAPTTQEQERARAGERQLSVALLLASWKEPTDEQVEFAHAVGKLLEDQLHKLPPTTTKEQGRKEWARVVAGCYAVVLAEQT